MEEVDGVGEERAPGAQALLGALLEALPGDGALLDAGGRLLLVNRAFAQTCGFLPQALRGRELLELVAGGDRPTVAALLSGRETEPSLFEASLLDAHGNPLPGRWRLAPAGEQGWRILSLLGAAEARPGAAPEAAPEGRRLVEVLAENPAPLALSETESGRLLEVNRAFELLTGYSRQELLGHRTSEVGLFASVEERQTIIAAARRGKHEAELHGRRKGGEPYDALMSVSEVQVRGRSCLLSVLFDITERKRIERELAESQQLLATIVGRGPAAIGVTELDSGRFIEVNGAFEAVTGLSREQALGHTSTELGLLTPEERDRIVAGAQRGEAWTEVTLRRGAEPRVGLMAAVLVQLGGKACLLTFFHDITERKRIERELGESQQLLATVFDRSPVAVALVAAENGRFLEVNRAWESVTGYRREEALGHTSVELGLLRPEESGRSLAKVAERRLLERWVEVHVTERSGRLRVGLMSVARVHARGQDCLLSVFQDITARKRNEEERERLTRRLAEQQEFLARLVDQLPVMIGYVDRDLVLRLCNSASAAMFGCPSAEIVGRRLGEVPVACGFEPDMRQVLETGQPIARHPVRLASRVSGEERILAASASPDLGPGGEVRGVFIEGSDVTALFRAERELRTERAMFTSAFEVLPVPSLLLSRAAVLRENSAARRLRERCGFASWLRLPLYEVPSGLAVTEEQRPSSRALQGETFQAREYQLGFGHAARVPVYVSAGPVTVDGEVVAAMVAVQDISALKAADRIKDEFLATVSHDLRSPLSAIQGWAQHLRKPHDPQSAARAVEAILRAAATQRRLIDDLLDASALAAGVLRVALSEQDLVPLVEDVVAGSEAAAAERGIALEARLPLAPLLARVDAVRVRQVASNLVDNALKATSKGGRVEVRLWLEGEQAVLEVRDSGQGISAGQLPHLFGRFYRGPGAEAAPGPGRHLGLGLTIVRALVELHGGSVSAASEGEGRGATFTVRLPALP